MIPLLPARLTLMKGLGEEKRESEAMPLTLSPLAQRRDCNARPLLHYSFLSSGQTGVVKKGRGRKRSLPHCFHSYSRRRKKRRRMRLLYRPAFKSAIAEGEGEERRRPM